MANKRPPGDDGQPVVATAKFKHNGEYVSVGDKLRMSVAEAADLVALGFVTRTDDSDRRGYARRDMRAKR